MSELQIVSVVERSMQFVLLKKVLQKTSCAVKDAKEFFYNYSTASFYVAQKLNNRSRKMLGYKTPHEMFCELAKLQGVALRV
jgi:IS30 family transposase